MNKENALIVSNKLNTVAIPNGYCQCGCGQLAPIICMANKRRAKMEEEKEYWVDDSNNRWKKSKHTLEQATTLSKTLIDCSYCSGCSDCSDCSDCTRCSGFKTQPQHYSTSLIGSRSDQTKFYWNSDRNQVVCGCFKGDLDSFEQRVKKHHGDNKYGIEYKKEIAIMRYLLSQ